MRYLSPDGEGSGGSSGNTTQTTQQTTQTTQAGDAARAADFESQLKQNRGDALRYAEKLHERVYQLRQRAQAAEAKLPAEGMTVIKEADANALKVYREIGTAAEITDRGDQLKSLQKYQMVSEAAQVSGMNPKVLSKLLPLKAKLEIGEATDENGQAKRVVNVTEEGKDKILLEEYAKSNWNDFLPALKAADEGGQTGTPWIQQQGSGKGDAGAGGNSVIAKRLERAIKRSSGKSLI